MKLRRTSRFVEFVAEDAFEQEQLDAILNMHRACDIKSGPGDGGWPPKKCEMIIELPDPNKW